MVTSLNYYLSGLSSVYGRNNQNLSQTLLKLASGKNFQSPSDDITSYFRSQDLQQQYDQYERMRPDMQAWKGAMDIASTAAEEINNGLERMKELSDLYASADPATKTAYTAEYARILDDVTEAVSNTYFDGASLLDNVSGSPIIKIDLVPDATSDSQRMVIDPGEAITIAHLGALTPVAPGGTIADAAVQTALTDSMGDIKTFLGNVSAYSNGLQSHLNITDSIMQNTKSAKSAITDIDTAQEMITYTQQEILSQTSLAMIAQANMSQKSILFLYGMNGSG